MAIFDKIKDSRWRKRIVEELEKNRAWKHYLFGNSWFCPYCAKMGVENGKDHPELPELILMHFKQCDFWLEFQGVAHSSKQLAENIRKIELANLMKSNPLWRIRDAEGRWHCPYCAKPPGIVFAGNRLTAEIVSDVGAHLDRCTAYDHGKGQAQTVQYILSRIENAARVKRLTAWTKEQISQNPLWQVTDENHHWVCPYCRRIVNTVDMGSEFLRANNAPIKASLHLTEICPDFVEGQPPRSTIEQLESVVSGAPETVSVVSRHELADSGMYSRVQTELEEMREMLRTRETPSDGQQVLLKSMEKAAEHQQQMLPEIPKLPGIEIEVLYRPVESVSGDFYDFIRVDKHLIGVVIGDVSGHGVEAGLAMSMIKKSLKIHGRRQGGAADTLRVTNADIHEDLRQETFCSVLYGLLDVRTLTLTFARAGHCPLIIYNPERQPALSMLEPRGLALGIDKGRAFNRSLEEMELKLRAGDMLMCFTDGLMEAINEQEEAFGIERICAAVERYGKHEAEYLTHMLDRTQTKFRAGASADDDLTIICMKVS